MDHHRNEAQNSPLQEGIMKTAERCANFLQSHGTAKNWQPLIMYNYGGRFLRYKAGPDWVVHEYRFDDDSNLDVRCSYYKTKQRTVEFLIKDTVVATVCSRNYMKF